ncbi:HEAT repeat domain-containing protein [Desulfosarcina ovata]|uniref:HEAT repeat domain-containing protein n=1 Tax=Desulfosarcina ovata subsp. ovata TaxID=2752305 RepID=A0A5K8A712_9BACT|nr:HEAT repeat domain-containing protein [Desulfosarcina ovata]BBO88402.1 hypothetical protein DSCOOX_15820 [Desulfosarcina ovata subsp. ovata]
MKRHGAICLAVLALLAASCEAKMNNTPENSQSATRAVESDIPALIVKLNAANPADRRAAAADLGADGKRASQAADALNAAAQQDEDAMVRVAAAQALWQVSGQPDKALDALRGELDKQTARYRKLAAIEDAQADDAHFDALFATLNQIRSIARVLGKMGPEASAAAPDLMTVLNERIGEGYEDLVPPVVLALGQMGPGAATVLPDLERFSQTDPGEQNRDVIAAAIAGIKGMVRSTRQSAHPDPITNPD